MKNIYILLLLSLSFSTTLLVPDEYSTIQNGNAMDHPNDCGGGCISISPVLL